MLDIVGSRSVAKNALENKENLSSRESANLIVMMSDENTSHIA
ncbi:hypothetical protein [Paraneptunicella aestuarii]|nr:hypothetical protein [Paraneptunicella aestuarii]